MDADTLERWTAAWPGVARDVKWEDALVFSVAGRMFCVYRLGGPRAASVSVKVDDDRFLAFTDRPGFAPAPYLARAKWVAVSPGAALEPDELHALVRRSYELVRGRLTRKLQRELAD